MVTWRAAALLGLGVATLWLWPLPWLALLLLIGLVAALCLVDWLLTPAPGALRIERVGDTRCRLGETAQTRLIVTNPHSTACRVEIRDGWTPSAGATPFSHRQIIEGGQTETFATTLTPTRRGDRHAVQVTTRCYGPLGFMFRQVRHRKALAATPPWTLRVLPSFTSRRHVPEKLAKLRTLDGLTSIRGRGQGSEFDTLREYVVGDDVRSIDWRGTARRADVVVRTWRPERSRRVVCVLDTGRTSAVRIGDQPRLEASIDAALLLATIAEHAGDQVDLIAADERVRAAVTRTAGPGLLPRIVNALAPLQPSLMETDFELVISEILRRERKRSLVVLFTALEPGALGEGLLPVLPRLAARHKVLVAAVHDPLLKQLATTPITDAVTVYERVAGVKAKEDRQRIITALTRHGVTVLDSDADTFASDVTDAYIAMKARGEL
jgi:uncharacterized protein (DUF58 family)